MTDEKGKAADERQLAVQRIYTKDISFETPNSPQVFTQEWKPEISVGLNSTVNPLGNNHFEVVLTVTVEAKHADNTAFLAEVAQAGIFLVSGFPDEEMGPLMGIAAPATLFPYVRETISDLVTRGSFPQFLLQPVNFEAAYMAQQKHDAEKQANPTIN